MEIDIPDARLRKLFLSVLDRLPTIHPALEGRNAKEVAEAKAKFDGQLDSAREVIDRRVTRVTLVCLIEKDPRIVGAAATQRGVGIDCSRHPGWIEFSAPQMARLSDAAVVGVMAHECGHVYERSITGDAYVNEPGESAEEAREKHAEREEDADNHARDWGFPEEIRAMRCELGHGE